MKPNKLALTLIAAALLPAYVFAGTDAVTASFERSVPYCELPAPTAMVTREIAIVGKADPVEEEVNTLVNGTDDPVLASYYRDLYRAPAAFETVEFVRTADPYMDAISIALWGKTERGSTQIC